MYNFVYLRPCSFWLVGEKKNDGEERKNCWDAARWKPSSSEEFGQMPELGNAVSGTGSVPSSQGEFQAGDGRDHPAHWELIVTSVRAQLQTVPGWRAAFWVCTGHSAASCDEKGVILLFAFSVV